MQNSKANRNLSSLADVINYYASKVYNYSFLFDTADSPSPEELYIAGFYRFEGQSNPSDNWIANLLIKKDNTEKGILVNVYRIYSTRKTSRFIQKVLDCKEE